MSNIETVNGNWYISTRTMDEILQKQTPDELQPFKELMRLPDSELVALLGDSADDLVDFRLGFTVLIEESLLTVNEKEVKSKMFDIDTNDFVHDRGILVQDNHNPLLTSLKLQWDQGTLDRLNECSRR